MIKARTVFLLLAIVFVGGCCSLPPKNVPDKETLEAQLGMKLPEAYEYLYHGDSGRVGDDYQEWILYSSTGFETEIQNIPEPVNITSELSFIQDVEADFQGKLKCFDIAPSVDAYAFSWDSADYHYRGSVLRTEKGDYVMIDRYPLSFIP